MPMDDQPPEEFKLPPMPGPSKSTLRGLAGMLPSVVEGIQKKTFKSARRKWIERVPTKKCGVCGKGWAKVNIRSDAPEADRPKLTITHCCRCNGMLKKGYTAFVGDGYFCFARSKTRVTDLNGQVIELPPEQMAEFKKQFNAEWNTREDATPTDQSLSSN
jgi:hypothetical protein